MTEWQRQPLLVAGEFRLFANLKTGVVSEKKLAVTASQMQKLVHTPRNRQLPLKVRQAQDVLSLMVLLQGKIGRASCRERV